MRGEMAFARARRGACTRKREEPTTRGDAARFGVRLARRASSGAEDGAVAITSRFLGMRVGVLVDGSRERRRTHHHMFDGLEAPGGDEGTPVGLHLGPYRASERSADLAEPGGKCVQVS